MCLWKTPKIPMPSVSARDLTPSTESQAPNSPKMGGSDDWKVKRRGAQGLQINRNPSIGGNSMNNKNNMYENGGWNI